MKCPLCIVVSVDIEIINTPLVPLGFSLGNAQKRNVSVCTLSHLLTTRRRRCRYHGRQMDTWWRIIVADVAGNRTKARWLLPPQQLEGLSFFHLFVVSNRFLFHRPTNKKPTWYSANTEFVLRGSRGFHSS